jgi:hypothetical protein
MVGLKGFDKMENGKSSDFYKRIFDNIECPGLVIDYKGTILTSNRAAEHELSISDESIGQSILSQPFLPDGEKGKFAHSLAKERVNIHSDKNIHQLKGNSGTVEYDVKVNKIESEKDPFMVLTFDKVPVLQKINSPRSRQIKSKHNKVSLNPDNVRKVLSLCDDHIKKVDEDFSVDLKKSGIENDSLDELLLAFKHHLKSMEITLKKINLLNSVTNDDHTSHKQYYSIRVIIDEIVEQLEPFATKLGLKINKRIDTDSFAYFDKESITPLIENLIYIKLNDSSKKDIEIKAKQDNSDQIISFTCCKSDFPYSEPVDDFSEEYMSKLIQQDKGLNKSVWHVMGDSLIDINNGKLLYSDLGDDEQIDIHLPMSPIEILK